MIWTVSRRSFAARAINIRANCAPNSHAHLRQFHRTPLSALPSKDSQDKDSLVPRSTEYSKSTSDDHAAATEQAAFDPNATNPEDAAAKADEETGEVRQTSDPSPLDASPGNPDLSKPKHEEKTATATSAGESEGGNASRARTSGRGSAPKSGGGKHGGGY